MDQLWSPVHGTFGDNSLALLNWREVMPYASGETPAVGDYVKNKWEQPGTVVDVKRTPEGDDYVSIRWDDSGHNSPLTPARGFILNSRQPN